jgi:hypothetical protein
MEGWPMKWSGSACGTAFCLALLAGPLIAQEAAPPGNLETPAVPAAPAAPEADAPLPPCPLPTACVPQSTLYPPPLFGDLAAISGARVVSIPPGSTPAAVLGQAPYRPLSGGRVAALQPLPFRSAFAASYNESPRPLDRAFLTYNYLNDVGPSYRAPGVPGSDLHQEVLGLEKTFLSGDASVGVRLPFLELAGNSSVADSQVGDMTVLFKYAFLNDPARGILASAGLALTLPTGPGLRLPGESWLNPYVIQPYAGCVRTWGNLYTQGFISVAVPTDARDTTLFFKSVAVGYWLYRDDRPGGRLVGIVPQGELHLTTPLDNRGSAHLPVGYPDTVDATGGCYFLFRHALLGLAAGAPLTGPKPFEYQVTATLNVLF